MADLIEAVREYALIHYEKDGWDFLVECWDVDDIAENIGTARTPAGAIKNCRLTCKAINERRQEARGAGGEY